MLISYVGLYTGEVIVQSKIVVLGSDFNVYRKDSESDELEFLTSLKPNGDLYLASALRGNPYFEVWTVVESEEPELLSRFRTRIIIDRYEDRLYLRSDGKVFDITNWKVTIYEKRD